jgi:membrane protein DedA with SNARE-associated domain
MDQLVSLITQYGYLILIPLAVFEGPVIALVAGFVVSLGYLKPVPVYLILIFGDVIPDIMYYYVGRFGNRRKLVEKYSARFGVIARNLKLADKLWRDHGKKTMFFSKVAYGLSTPLLISAGLINLPLRRFIAYALPVTLAQHTILLSIGYGLGNSFQLAVSYFRYVELGMALALIILIMYVALSGYARVRIGELAEEVKEDAKKEEL